LFFDALSGVTWFARLATTAITTLALALAMFASHAARGLLGCALILGHRIMLKDFSFEDPNFNTASAIGCMRSSRTIINICTQRM
jgi:hypothetical protein